MRYFIGLIFFLSMVMSQVTDKNFKDEIGDGFSVVVFTSEWQEQDLNEEILKVDLINKGLMKAETWEQIERVILKLQDATA